MSWLLYSWSILGLVIGFPTLSVAEKKLSTTTAEHWAFQAVPPPPPEATIDSLVQKNLHAQGLTLAPPADRLTLIRRAYFNLIGLPPSYQEIENFTHSTDSALFEKTVDHLLSDSRFGERWARHWLDVARYADSKGYVFKEESRYAYSYTYRDWVISAFNEDLSYDRFILAQLAADQSLALEDKRHYAAMGYLTVGRRFIGNVHDIIDDRIDVTFRGFQALTVSCARCHDHKSDPISTADYYSLYGVFASCEEPDEGPLINDPEANPAYAEYKKGLGEKENELKEYVRSHLEESLQQASVKKYLSMLIELWTKDYQAIRISSINKLLQPVFVSRWQTYLKDCGVDHPKFGLFIRLAATSSEPWEKVYPEIFAAWKPHADPAWAAELEQNPPVNLMALTDLYAVKLTSDDESWKSLLRGPRGPADFDPWLLAGELENGQKIEVLDLKSKIGNYIASSPHAPPRAMVLNDRKEPSEPFIFKRGNPGIHGEAVPRQFLECLSGDKRQPFTQGSGRLEMAKAIANFDNPLTARVYVNRVWGWLTGQPLVESTSDFGFNTPRPVQHELLDYLARRFIETGGSTKKLIREILLSQTWQQTSQPVRTPEQKARYQQVDPENRYLSRMRPRRRELESYRDTLLWASGRLDLTQGGRPVDITSAEATRRTIYGFIDRQNLPGLFRAFDLASPDQHAPRRFQTTVPQQALFLLNDPFLTLQAQSLIDSAPLDEEARINFLYQRIFSRSPQPEEIAEARRYLAHPPMRQTSGLWDYGYGFWDETTHQVKFTPFPFYQNKRWAGSAEPIHPEIGWAMISADHSHPGSGDSRSVIWRWEVPTHGTYRWKGQIERPSPNGDGLRLLIVTSSGKILHQQNVLPGEKFNPATEAHTFSAGDYLIIIVDSRHSDNYDTFYLTGQIIDETNGLPLTCMKEDFCQPVLPIWVSYAQALLMSNELAFVD